MDKLCSSGGSFSIQLSRLGGAHHLHDDHQSHHRHPGSHRRNHHGVSKSCEVHKQLLWDELPVLNPDDPEKEASSIAPLKVLLLSIFCLSEERTELNLLCCGVKCPLSLKGVMSHLKKTTFERHYCFFSLEWMLWAGVGWGGENSILQLIAQNYIFSVHIAGVHITGKWQVHF